MKIHTINDLTNTKLINFLKTNLSAVTEEYLIKNYHPDYASTPGNLFFILNEGRYTIGNYFIMIDKGEYVGSAGWNAYTDDTALALTRAYVPQKYRTNYFMAKYLLPRIFRETLEYEKLWITCNGYNKSIYDALVKMSQGKRAGIFNPWPPVYKNFKPLGTRVINNTLQYVAEYKRNVDAN